MTENRLHVAVIFCGCYGEHGVSLMPARSLLSVLDPAKYGCIRPYAVRAHKADGDHTSHTYWSET
jgi:hypothetical protein